MAAGTSRSIPGFVAGVMLAVAVAVIAAVSAPAWVAPAHAQDQAALNAEGQAAVDAWIKAVASGDPERVRAHSAPEFQIVRGDGSAHTLDDYLSDLPVLVQIPSMENVFATATGDQMVVRYTVDAEKEIGGKTVDAFGPRLTVLRKQGDVWLVVAHSNFATVAQDPGAQSIDDASTE